MKKKLFSKLAAAALAASMVIGTATTALSTYAANLNQVTGLSVVERDDDELTLRWKKVSGADGYLLYRYNTNTKKWQKIKTTSKTRYEVEHLKAGTKYHFAVRAYDKTKSVPFQNGIEVVGLIRALLGPDDGHLDDIAHDLFQGLTVFFIHRQHEEGQHPTASGQVVPK